VLHALPLAGKHPMGDREKSNEIYSLASEGDTMTRADLERFLEIVFIDLGAEHTSQLLQAVSDPVTKEEFFTILMGLVQRKVSTADVFGAWCGKRKSIGSKDLEGLLRSYALDVDRMLVEGMMGVLGKESVVLEDLEMLVREDH
jgi:hypothetical protein